MNNISNMRTENDPQLVENLVGHPPSIHPFIHASVPPSLPVPLRTPHLPFPHELFLLLQLFLPLTP